MGQDMKLFASQLLLLLALAAPQFAHADIGRFVGVYHGSLSAQDSPDGKELRLRVEINEIDEGFNVEWNTTAVRADGKAKSKTYAIDFITSQRENVFSSAMKANLFGKRAALDPMRGDPYFWGRITGDTLTVFALLISDDGGYEIQRYDRTLVPQGLQLHFTRSSAGKTIKTVESLLAREN